MSKKLLTLTKNYKFMNDTRNSYYKKLLNGYARDEYFTMTRMLGGSCFITNENYSIRFRVDANKNVDFFYTKDYKRTLLGNVVINKKGNRFAYIIKNDLEESVIEEFFEKFTHQDVDEKLLELYGEGK